MSSPSSPQLQPLDPAAYVTPPRLTVSSAVSLGITLLAATPKPAPLHVRRGAQRLRAAVLDLQDAWGRQLDLAEASAVAAPREADTRSDRSVRATAMRIEAFVLLGPAATPEHSRAVAARARLFPDGLRFLTLPWQEQWAHVERLIKLIDGDPELAADLDALVGPSILAELHAAHEAYGQSLGITARPPAAPHDSLTSRLEAVRAAIVGYALQVVAMQDVDPTRIEAARTALAPLDEHRARQARRRAASARAGASEATPDLAPEAEADLAPEPEPEEDPQVTPQTPVPPLDDVPADASEPAAAVPA